MIEADTAYRRDCRVDYARRIPAAAETDLEHREVHSLVREEFQRGGGEVLELREDMLVSLGCFVRLAVLRIPYSTHIAIRIVAADGSLHALAYQDRAIVRILDEGSGPFDLAYDVRERRMRYDFAVDLESFGIFH